jgi:hypothetical protein
MTTTSTSTFEDRLLTELKREAALAAAEDRQHGHAPGRRRLLTPARAGIGLATAAAAAGAFVVLPGGGAAPAYAVERTGDGGIDVTISDWPRGEEEVRDFAALMEENGVATIYNPPSGYLCQPLLPGDQLTPSGMEGSPGEGGAETISDWDPAGGATVIGPRVGESSAPSGPQEDAENPGGGAEDGHAGAENSQEMVVESSGRAENPGAGAEDGHADLGEAYVYHLSEGDTVILTEVEATATITFVEGGCDPVR